MDTEELKIFMILKEKFHLSDEDETDFAEAFKQVRENSLKSSMEEFKSLFEDYFHKIELKSEQNKSDIDLKFEEQNTKLEGIKSRLKWKIEKTANNVITILCTLGFIASILIVGIIIWFINSQK